MKKIVLATVAMIFFALQSMFVPATVVTVATVISMEMAWADNCVSDVNCNQPTGVGKGQKVPVWKVLYCFIGPADGKHEKLACQDPRAVHLSPRGKPVVCFLGSDGKPHWDRQENVTEGRAFINQKVSGVWYVNWK